jgi:flagellar protein FliO/FliZ
MSPALPLSLFPSPSSVTRWLLVVVGCAILEMAQPMIAADSPPPAPEAAAPVAAPAPTAGARPDDLVIHPAASPSPASSSSPAAPGFGPGWVFVFLVAASSAAWWAWQRRRSPLAARREGIQIEDTRALGNRQFLVVATARGRRFFLGVSPGGIRLLAPLDADDPEDAPDA